MNINFQGKGISQELIINLGKLGYQKLTGIQEKTISFALNGDNILGISKTGTGKTGAFLIPIVEKILREKESQERESFKRGCFVKSLIIAPTRELAQQIQKIANDITANLGITVFSFVGGIDISNDLERIRRGSIDILVGTPGRLSDHIRAKRINLEQQQFFVLDEVDEMLKVGFLDEIREIRKTIGDNKNLQTLFFSATIFDSTKLLIQEFLGNNYKTVDNTKESSEKPRINQLFLRIRTRDGRTNTLIDLIYKIKPTLSMIFVGKKVVANELTKALNEEGIRAGEIHGDLSQKMRTKVLNDFKTRRFNVLVATDVAARGIDIPDVSHVFNFSAPHDNESYTHRIGRTGRAGKEGTSIILFNEWEVNRKKAILEGMTNSKIVEMENPSHKEVDQIIAEESLRKFIKKIEERKEVPAARDSVEALNSYSKEEIIKGIEGLIRVTRNRISHRFEIEEEEKENSFRSRFRARGRNFDSKKYPFNGRRIGNKYGGYNGGR